MGRFVISRIPAVDIDASAAFYTEVFGWATRTRGDGHKAFDDGRLGVVCSAGSADDCSGPDDHIMVDDSVPATIDKVT